MYNDFQSTVIKIYIPFFFVLDLIYFTIHIAYIDQATIERVISMQETRSEHCPRSQENYQLDRIAGARSVGSQHVGREAAACWPEL